jgi:hypothetical protein
MEINMKEGAVHIGKVVFGLLLVVLGWKWAALVMVAFLIPVGLAALVLGL